MVHLCKLIKCLSLPVASARRSERWRLTPFPPSPPPPLRPPPTAMCIRVRVRLVLDLLKSDELNALGSHFCKMTDLLTPLPSSSNASLDNAGNAVYKSSHFCIKRNYSISPPTTYAPTNNPSASFFCQNYVYSWTGFTVLAHPLKKSKNIYACEIISG